MTAPASESTVEPTLELLVRATLGRAVDGLSAELFPPLAQDLDDIDLRLQSVLPATYAQLTEAAAYACRTGGKRLRPLLMAVGYRALGNESTVPVHALAAAFQLIHTASLVHDDVIDHAELRRGRASLPRAFGLPTAIVTGDYLFVRAFELAGEYSGSIIRRCGEACADLAEGEVLQEQSRFDLTTGREHYFRVIERKTAAIVAAGLASVAEIAGASRAVIDAYATYGKAVGIAFQLADDLLDVFGDPDLLGKPLYSDLREGNPTLVALAAYDALAEPDRVTFERLFARRRKSPQDLLRLRALIDRAGAGDRVRAEAARWAERALVACDQVPAGPYRVLLMQLARGAAARRF
ncbi:MAG TPA: polyprenyl synthetase family protein [Thermoplasmata archaeon]|nr:polyprenyl synthetase family protein [Thermoplasmata archaeon]